MNWWMGAGRMALIYAVGHAIATLPADQSGLAQRASRHGVGMWYIITINLTLLATALAALSVRGCGNIVAALVAAQFAGYATSISSYHCVCAEP